MLLFIRLTVVLLIGTLYVHNSFASSAIEAFQHNRLNEAKINFQAQLKDPEKNKLAHYYLAKIYLAQQELKSALEHIEKATAIGSVRAEEYLVQGKIYGAKAQTASIFKKLKFAKRCLENFEKAHAADPNNIDALHALIDFHQLAPGIAGGSKEKRDQYIEKIEALAPELAKVKRIQKHHMQKEHEQARQLALLLYKEKLSNIDAHYALAKFFKEEKDYSRAAGLFSQLAEKNDTQLSRRHRWLILDANLQLAEVYLGDNSQLEKGIKLIQHYQTLNNNPNDPHYYWAFWSLAKLYKANNNLDAYEQVVQKIKSMDYKDNKHFAQEFDDATI